MNSRSGKYENYHISLTIVVAWRAHMGNRWVSGGVVTQKDIESYLQH